MSKCDLYIRLDRADRVYNVGDTISGAVHVTVDKEVNCREIKIENFWKTRGKGNTDSATASQESVFPGILKPGMYEYPFSFEVEEFPITYHGNYLNIDWHIKAQADIPWAFDPKYYTDYVVTRGEQPQEVPNGANPYRPDLPMFVNKMNTPPYHIFAGISVTIFLFGLLMILQGVTRPFEIASLLPGGIFLLIPFFFSLYFVRKLMVLSKLGRISCKVTPQEIAPGGNFAVSVGFRPKSNGLINKITFTIKGREIVVSGSGTRRTTHSKTFFEKHVTLIGGLAFRAGKYVYEEGGCTIPANAGPSFKSSDNEIKWTVDLHIDIDNWPDWRESKSILVM